LKTQYLLYQQCHKELTLDYGTIANNDLSFECKCGSKNCRKMVTGKDWQNLEIQEKYLGYFTDYIQSLIDKKKHQN